MIKQFISSNVHVTITRDQAKVLSTFKVITLQRVALCDCFCGPVTERLGEAGAFCSDVTAAEALLGRQTPQPKQ